MSGGRRSYDGPPLDGTVQHISERPYGGGGETVEATPDADGEVTTEDVPLSGDDPHEGRREVVRQRVDGDGQTTWDDWGWSA
jgi:hypothetical protein